MYTTPTQVHSHAVTKRLCRFSSLCIYVYSLCQRFTCNQWIL